MKPSELRANVGQLVIMGFTGTEPGSTLRVVLRAIQPGGIVLFARNITVAQQTWDLLDDCRKQLRESAFLCVDLEGGTVDRLRDVIAPAPSAAEVGNTGDRKLFRRHGRVIGECARALGFNTDFAPVFDLGFEASRPVLTTRVVSSSAAATVEYTREFLRGLRDARVLGCGKHFPGLGEAKLDTHHELPSIAKTFDAMWREDLVPYRELRREVPFVMVAHANYPAVTRDKLPASLSKRWMSKVLRKRIGYKGLILADDLEMGGVLAADSLEGAAIDTLRAGADMFLVCHNEEAVWRTYEAVVREAERDKKFAKYVAVCARRVRDVKKRSRELKGQAPRPSESVVEHLRKEIGALRQQIDRYEAERL
jgi:beta-N-acetylhexosaminidase